MKYITAVPFKTLCCQNIQGVGTILEIVKQTSKNRLTVKDISSNGCHNVKRSTFMRCCKELNECPVCRHLSSTQCMCCGFSDGDE